MTSGIAETDGLGSVDAEGLLLLFLSKVGGSSLGPGTFPLLPILPAAVPVPLPLPISLRNGCWKASSNRCTYIGHLKNNGMTESQREASGRPLAQAWLMHAWSQS